MEAYERLIMQNVVVQRPGASARYGRLVTTRPDKTYPDQLVAVIDLYPLALHTTLTCPAKWVREVD